MNKTSTTALLCAAISIGAAAASSAACISPYHCVKTGTCLSVGQKCTDVTGGGISISIIGSGGGITTAFSYEKHGNPNLYVGTAMFQSGSKTNVYQMKCGWTKYYAMSGCNGYIGFLPIYVSTCNIIPGQ